VCFEVVKEKSAEYGIYSKEDCAHRLGGSKQLDEKILHDDFFPPQARATHPGRQNIAFNEPGFLSQGTALLHSNPFNHSESRQRHGKGASFCQKIPQFFCVQVPSQRELNQSNKEQHQEGRKIGGDDPSRGKPGHKRMFFIMQKHGSKNDSLESIKKEHENLYWEEKVCVSLRDRGYKD
jgi:hypothetical protein